MSDIHYHSPAEVLGHILKLAASPEKAAAFFDADGTIALFHDDPQAVRLPEAVSADIRKLYTLTRGAVAIVTGRDPEFINNTLLPDFKIPSSYVHGAFIREVFNGAITQSAPHSVDEQKLDEILSGWTLMDGMEIEYKHGARAIKWHQCTFPHDIAERYAEKISARAVAIYNEGRPVAEHLNAEIGRKVFEIGSAEASKGKAVDRFMELSPFKGRIPFFFGDQPADAPGMIRAQAHGGIGIGVGKDAPGIANFRVQSPLEVYTLLNLLTGDVAWGKKPREMKPTAL